MQQVDKIVGQGKIAIVDGVLIVGVR